MAGEVRASHLLMAVGRRPNTDDLGLDKAGIATDKRGFIPVDDTLRTSVPGYFPGRRWQRPGAFTHTSYNDFEIAAARRPAGTAKREGPHHGVCGTLIRSQGRADRDRGAGPRTLSLPEDQ